jgi:hypothetical protein
MVHAMHEVTHHPFMYPEDMDAMDLREQEQTTQAWPVEDFGDLSSVTYASEELPDAYTVAPEVYAAYEPVDDTMFRLAQVFVEATANPDSSAADNEVLAQERDPRDPDMSELSDIEEFSDDEDFSEDFSGAINVTTRRDSPWPFAAQPLVFSIDFDE